MMCSLMSLPCSLLASLGQQCSPMLLVKPAWTIPPLLIFIICVATAAFAYKEELCSESNYAFLAASNVKVVGLIIFFCLLLENSSLICVCSLFHVPLPSVLM